MYASVAFMYDCTLIACKCTVFSYICTKYHLQELDCMLIIVVTSIMSQLPIILLWYYQVQPMTRLMSTATPTPHYGMWATLFFIMVIELVVVAITITTLFQELQVL